MNEAQRALCEQLANEADKMDYSSCSDSGIVIGIRKGFTAAIEHCNKEHEKCDRERNALQGAYSSMLYQRDDLQSQLTAANEHIKMLEGALQEILDTRGMGVINSPTKIAYKALANDGKGKG
jgi:hypothetical protein